MIAKVRASKDVLNRWIGEGSTACLVVFSTCAALVFGLIASPVLAVDDRGPAPIVARLLWSGPAGDFTSFQDALEDAALVGGNVEIRVRGDLVLNELLTLDVETGDFFTISGGWNSTFDLRSEGSTTIDVNDAGRPMTIDATGGLLFLSGFRFEDGYADDGGGLKIEASNDAEVSVTAVELWSNRGHNVNSAHAAARGGGLFLDATDDAVVDLEELDVRSNFGVPLEDGGHWLVTQGGGIWILSREDASVSLQDSELSFNNCSVAQFGEAAESDGCNLYVEIRSHGSVTLRNNVFDRGTVDGVIANADHPTNGAIYCRDNGQLVEEQNQWLRGGFANPLPGMAISFYLSTEGSCSATLRSSTVADSPGDGLYIDDVLSATIRVVNYTLANNGRLGMGAAGGLSDVAVSNTLAFGNGLSDASLVPIIVQTNNLFGTDPMWVDPANRNYDLLPGSPALEAGTGAPPGGLSSGDVLNRPRQVGVVDIGAWEAQLEPPLFASGFETGDLSEWDASSR